MESEIEGAYSDRSWSANTLALPFSRPGAPKQTLVRTCTEILGRLTRSFPSHQITARTEAAESRFWGKNPMPFHCPCHLTPFISASDMQNAVKAVQKFQNVALVATAGAIGYYYLNERADKADGRDIGDQSGTRSRSRQSEHKKYHTLTGEEIAPDQQVSFSPEIAPHGSGPFQGSSLSLEA